MLRDPTISLAANGKLALTITSDSEANSGFHLGHTIEIPNNENGLRIINQILSARNDGKSKLGQAGNPTQEMIKLWLANKFEQDRLTARQEMLSDF